MKRVLSVALFCIIACTNAFAQKMISISYYGTPIEVSSFSVPTPLKSLEIENISATAGSIEGAAGFKKLLNECTELKSKLRLNDWGYLKLTDKVAHTCMKNESEAVLLMYMLMAGSGYDVKLIKSNDALYLTFRAAQQVYDCNYVVDNNRVYYFYPTTAKPTNTSICNVSFAGSKPISLLVEQAPNLAKNESPNRELKSKKYPDWDFTVSCNKNLIDFYNDFPAYYSNNNFVTRWVHLTNTPLSEDVQRQLYPKMHQLIKGLSQREAAERVLNWIQTAFEYKFDDQVWGKDRAFYPEEMLYYPYSDTEDRSALMARIMTDVLKLKTIFIYFPGHTSVGVAFTDEDVEGDYVMYEGQKYLICDGIYFNATVGKKMPPINLAEAKALPVSAVSKPKKAEIDYQTNIEAAMNGDADAQNVIAACYISGKGVTKDYAQAATWWRKAAEQGHAEAQCNLGVCYSNGMGITQDKAQAAFWYRKSAEQGHADGQFNIGACYAEGTGVEKDVAQAIFWYRKAVDQGHAAAMNNLAIKYVTGNGVAEDYDQAIALFRKAAEKGNVSSIYCIGLCYEDGRGVPQDYVQAATWFRKAAEMEDEVSQYKLGWCYENGQGVTKDIEQAIFWYRRAAKLGYQKAKEALQKLEGQK